MQDLMKYISSMFGSKGVSLDSAPKADYPSVGHAAPYKGAGRELSPVEMVGKGNYGDAARKAISILGAGSDATGPIGGSVGGMGMMGIQNAMQGASGQAVNPSGGSIIAPVADDSAARMQMAQQLMNTMLASRRAKGK